MKTNKILFFAAAAAIFAVSAAGAQNAAQTSAPVRSKVTAATIFLNGAELTANASVTLKKGVNEVFVDGLPTAFDANSLKVTIPGGNVVMAFDFSGDRSPDQRTKNLRDSIRIYETQLSGLDVDIAINKGLMDYLEKGVTKSVSGSEGALNMEELRKTMDYYSVKAGEIHTSARELTKNRAAVHASLSRARLELQKMSRNPVLRLSVSAPAAGTFPVTLSYFTHAASWLPYYDVNVASAAGPIKFAAKAHVAQTTGTDWKDVRLTLSTTVPSSGKTAPLFSTWFLRQVYNGPVYRTRAAETAVQNTVSYGQGSDVASGTVMDDKGQPLVGATILIKGSTSGTITNYDGTFSIKVPSSRTVIQISFLGFESREMMASQNMRIVMQQSKGVTMPEVVVQGMYVTDKRLFTGATDHLENSAPEPLSYASENAISVTYNIALPYTIPGDGKEQNIDLTTVEAPAEYKYYCAPKLDPSVYLIAEIPNWQSLGLLSAPANITYDGTYIGETYLDTSATDEKLSLTLGTDKRVAVTRELEREFSATKTVGGNVERTYTYRITVRNGQSAPIAMVLKEQYPVSTDKTIVVTLDTKSTTPPDNNNTATGVLTWDETLDAGATRTYTVSYTIRYPKDLRLNL